MKLLSVLQHYAGVLSKEGCVSMLTSGIPNLVVNRTSEIVAFNCHCLETWYVVRSDDPVAVDTHTKDAAERAQSFDED